MNLKPELQTVLTNLGITPDELNTLESRMMFSVTTLQAQLSALNAQIETLTNQRQSVEQELNAANITVLKLIDTSEN
jgi:CII-binding regulator of phage lambda lysogenization HflD